GLISRMLRDEMLEAVGQDYTRTARAKGIKESTVIMRHTFRNALIPSVTVIGSATAGLLGGTVIIETLFTIPGIGQLLIDSIHRRDFPVIQGVVLFTAVIYVIVNLFVDLLYALFDSRIRYDGSKRRRVCMLKKKRNLAAISLLILIIVGTFAASAWISLVHTEIDPESRLLAPSITHWFGTDDFGRDILLQTLLAAKVSLLLGFVVAVCSTILGTFTGLIAGYYKKADFIIMRVIDGMLAFPALLLALALVAALGGSITNIIIALIFAFWPVMTRVVRSVALQVGNVQYIEAAKSTGASDVVIILKYMLPNMMTPIIVQGTFIFAKAILAEAALNFLGVGADPSIPTWGAMLKEAQTYLTTAPWFSVFPGVAIVLTVLSLNVLGDGLREALNPRTASQSFRKNRRRKEKKIVA